MKKANLFKPEEIAEIQVTCPKTGENYVCDLNDPDLFCPACGEPHEPKNYHVYYKDGSNAYANCLYMPKIPETIEEFVHSEPELDGQYKIEVDEEEEACTTCEVAPPVDFCNLDIEEDLGPEGR